MPDTKPEFGVSSNLPEYKLSVITVNLNNANGLLRTIESVLSQTFSSIQFIVIDGVSSDGSVEIIENHNEDIHYWISEKDSGVYSAMNKGILKAKGEYLIFLNSGDSFIDNDIVRKVFAENDNSDIIYGYIDTPVGVRKYPEKLDVSFLARKSLHHQATFIRKNLFDTIGLYDEKNRFESDWEFFMRAILINKCSTYSFKHVVSFFEMGGLSSNPKLNEIKYKEKKEVIRRVMPELADWYSDYIDLHQEKRALEAKSLGIFYRIADKITNSKLIKLLQQKRKKSNS
jgi:glycosyltransferase involved in cell wall biosynthesis